MQGVLLLIILTSARAQERLLSPIVELSNGTFLRGTRTMAANDQWVTEFLGVPFAEPPIREYRFAPPVAKVPWSGVRNATELPNSCMQNLDTKFVNFKGAEEWNANTNRSEDCLFLNVWVPGSVDSRKRLPVMVWIFGGGFYSGTSTLDVYDGKILCSEQQVIVVSMNYRVTMFGFLYLGIAEAPGNMGLLDQLEALKWVRKYITVFGGDPNLVTIFGESAGAASVSMHILSPLSQPYFRRAILQSGSALAGWAITPKEEAVQRSLLLSEACKCNVSGKDGSKDLRKTIDCMKSLDIGTLLSHEWVTYDFNEFPFTPVVDGHFLTAEPEELLVNGTIKNTELLVGSNRDESIFFVVYFQDDIFKKEDMFSRDDFLPSNSIFEKAVKELLPEEFRKHPVIREAVVLEYGDQWRGEHTSEDGVSANKRRLEALDKVMGDFHFTCAVNEFASVFQQRNGPVYYYYFTHRSTQQSWPEWMGVVHGYEINFVFGEPLNAKNHSYTEEEKELSRRFMQYWANFARTG